jgi:hypothetical protein
MFSVKAEDAEYNTSIVLVTISVLGINDAPTVYNQILETSFNTPVSGILIGRDPDGNSLTYSIVDGTLTGGTLTSFNASTGEFTFTPTTDFSEMQALALQLLTGTAELQIQA